MSATHTQPATTSLHITQSMVEEFKSIFVNRLAYVIQAHKADERGRFNYFLAARKISETEKEPIKLDAAAIAGHLMGDDTIGVYAIAPGTNTCKWIAIDADYDYEQVKADLWKLKQAFAKDGFEALLENSRRGAHLWLFLAEPIPAAICRLYVLYRANQLEIPIKVKGTDDGIEVFPKQDGVSDGEYGNAIKAPFGIHRASMKRYWFEGADENLEDQFALIRSVKRVGRAELERLTADMKLPENEPAPAPKPFKPVPTARYTEPGKPFEILEALRANHITYYKSGEQYVAPCPVCDTGERRRYRWHLKISVKEPNKYRCWRDCTADQIREALGRPRRPYNGPSRF